MPFNNDGDVYILGQPSDRIRTKLNHTQDYSRSKRFAIGLGLIGLTAIGFLITQGFPFHTTANVVAGILFLALLYAGWIFDMYDAPKRNRRWWQSYARNHLLITEGQMVYRLTMVPGIVDNVQKASDELDEFIMWFLEMEKLLGDGADTWIVEQANHDVLVQISSRLNELTTAYGSTYRSAIGNNLDKIVRSLRIELSEKLRHDELEQEDMLESTRKELDYQVVNSFAKNL